MKPDGGAGGPGEHGVARPQDHVHGGVEPRAHGEGRLGEAEGDVAVEYEEQVIAEVRPGRRRRRAQSQGDDHGVHGQGGGPGQDQRGRVFHRLHDIQEPRRECQGLTNLTLPSRPPYAHHHSPQ